MITKHVFLLNLCARCLSNEINSWVEENWKNLNDDAKIQIREILKTIKLKEGECIVCKNSFVSDNASQKVLNILKSENSAKSVIGDFRKSFVV